MKTNINEFVYLLISQTQSGFYGIFIFYMGETNNDLYKKCKLLFMLH